MWSQSGPSQPRLRSRLAPPRHDLGVRIGSGTRKLIDRLAVNVQLATSEIGRVLLTSGLYVGTPLRDRVAVALFNNATMHVHGETSRVAQVLEDDLASLTTIVARGETPSTVRASSSDRGRCDPTLLRLRLPTILYQRFRCMVDLYSAVRHDGDVPQPADETERRLIDHLLSRSAREIRRERSGVAEVVRWALVEAEPDADEVFDMYVKCRNAMWSRIERAMQVMREGATAEIRAALGRSR